MVKLSSAQVAALTGVKLKTWSAYVTRGQRPAPDGRAEPCGCPWWWETTIAPYVKGQQGSRRKTT